MTIIATTEVFELTNVGATANDGTGDGLRDAFIKINKNFSNIADIGMETANLHVTNSVIVENGLQVNGNINSTLPSDGAITTSGGLGVARDSTLGGNISLYSNIGIIQFGEAHQHQITWNHDSAFDALQIRAGSRVNSNVFAGGDVVVSSIVNTNTTTSGPVLLTLDPYNNLDGGQFSIQVAPQDINGNIANYSSNLSLSPTNLSVTSPAINLNGELTVTGNLTITGAVNEYLTNTFVTTDSMLYVNQYTTDDTKDIGLVGAYINAGEKHAGIVRDASDGIWKFFHGIATEPDSTVNFTGATYSDIQIGTLNTTGMAVSGSVGILGVLYANNATASTNTTSGALRVAGGAGVTGDLFVGASINAAGVLYANNATASTNTTSGALRVAGGAGIAGALYIGSTLSTAGTLFANITTASTSTSTGGLIVAGGAGVAGSIFAGASINAAGVLYANNATAATNTTSGGLRATGGAGIAGDLFVGSSINAAGVLYANNATAATNTTSGGLRVAGGLAVVGNVFASNVLATIGSGYANITGTGGTITQATSKTTAVTINKPSGNIILNGAALANGANVSFTLNNTTISNSDLLLLNIASGATPGAYHLQVQGVATGSANIALYNVYGASLSEAIVLNFAVFKASNQ